MACTILQDAVELYIEVSDYDSFNSNDHVDDIYVTISLTPNATFTPRQVFIGNYGNSRIELSFRVQCSSNFYGNNCTTFCDDGDDPNGRQLYTCGSDGQKICLSGWSEPSRNCTVRKYITINFVAWKVDQAHCAVLHLRTHAYTHTHTQ